MFSNLFFFRKLCRFGEKVEKYGRTGQATDDKQRMRFAFRITKATDTRSENVIDIAFQGYIGCANATQCYICTYVNLSC